MINRLQAFEKWIKCTNCAKSCMKKKDTISCFSVSFFGWRPLSEMYIPLPAVIRHDSLSKWQIIAGGPKEGIISSREAWSKSVLPFSLMSNIWPIFLECCYLLVDVLSKIESSFKGLSGRFIYENVSMMNGEPGWSKTSVLLPNVLQTLENMGYVSLIFCLWFLC